MSDHIKRMQTEFNELNGRTVSEVAAMAAQLEATKAYRTALRQRLEFACDSALSLQGWRYE